MENKKYNIITIDENKTFTQKLKEAFKISSVPVLIASLCCLSPVILFSLGLVSVSVAGELSDVFYGTYKWVFRAVGLVALLVAFYFYLQKSGVCTFDEALKRRNEIINKLLLILIAAVFSYVVFLYVIVHYVGVFLNIWR